MSLLHGCRFLLLSLSAAIHGASAAGAQDEGAGAAGERARLPTVPRVEGTTREEAKRAVDAYATQVLAVIQSLAEPDADAIAQRRADRAQDRLEALLDDVQDQVDRGDLALAREGLDTFQESLGTAFRQRFAPRLVGAFAAVLLSHAAGERGVAGIPDRASFERLSYQGAGVQVAPHLQGIECVKFFLRGAPTGRPSILFLDTNTFRSHQSFFRALGVTPQEEGGAGNLMMGMLCHRPFLTAPDGTAGLYTFEFGPIDAYPFALVDIARQQLVRHAPFLRGKLAYQPLARAMEVYRREERIYHEAALPIFLAEDVYRDISYLPLNPGVGIGTLRRMEPGQRPGPRDVVLYPTLPNEMPRVAGVITAVRQTPLSHVNLRAVQDGIPNAYVRDAGEVEAIASLVGKKVRYEVRMSGYSLREASAEEIERHVADSRPREPQVPAADLSVRRIRPLDEIGFDESRSVGVKAANLAVLRRLGFPAGTVPDGFAVPFAFYDDFMRLNGLDEHAAEMAEAPGFRDDASVRATMLAELRERIRAGEVPQWMHEALGEVQAAFPPGTGIRCRSSTNNEDLPGFSGAGLYGSYTHRHQDRPLARTIVKVYSSLWTFRAFEAREFHRVDHGATAMGVLLHANYADEQANGVAVAEDFVYQSAGPRYYVNIQIGEDMVTNPEGPSIPEELLLSPSGMEEDRLVCRSNRVRDGVGVLDLAHRDQLRGHLGRIQRKFRKLYERPRSGGDFAMEVEFKITADGTLAIKQARPWVR